MRPMVEVLSFAGCPNREGAIALVERVSAELGNEPELRLVDVPDSRTAKRERFLGSPTIRVDGRDIEPGAEAGSNYTLACRVYRTGRGVSGQPNEHWLRHALERSGPARIQCDRAM
jgi:hypothetical protein